MASSALGSHAVRFQWVLGDRIWGSTNHEVHLLAARPAPPWSSVSEAGDVPTAGALRLAAGVVSVASSESEANRRFCSQIVTWIQTSKKLV
ncbi:hypothetical protein [Paraeggerthella hongkongensis]|uniref:Uncharacterized protein n=1 Tax=Paraeggerthella hongkongensis TaxID=230658 RepID=A0A3N0BE44_9ACTN|nr:hypothetical protein [Paraeggerthella hongkongensis]RNL45772.1 hypothetical protein DMP08_05495 [Paraeggerthella hongkongensis]